MAATLAAPASAAAQARLTIDPVAPCYRERQAVFLRGTGFTPNAAVNFTRDGQIIIPEDPIAANPSGQFFPQLDLPSLVSGQRPLTYVATDSSAVSAQVTLLVTATAVRLTPQGGAPHRRLRVRARGFFGGTTLYAHVVRGGRRPGRARNLRVGPVKGACKRVEARKRLFSRNTRPGRYRVQFDTFRRYQAGRKVQSDFNVTVYRTADAARATRTRTLRSGPSPLLALSPAS